MNSLPLFATNWRKRSRCIDEQAADIARE